MYPSTQFVRSRMSPVGLLLLLFVPPRSALSSLGGIYINTCDSDCRPQKYTPYRHRHLWEGQSLSEKKENFPDRGLRKDFGIRSQFSSLPQKACVKRAELRGYYLPPNENSTARKCNKIKTTATVANIVLEGGQISEASYRKLPWLQWQATPLPVSSQRINATLASRFLIPIFSPYLG